MSEGISFEGQVAIVTGAGRGIGRSYALELARRGAAVVVNDVGRDEPGGAARAEAVVEEIVRAGGKAVASLDSVATEAGGLALTELALSAFGTVDVLINNAGYLQRGMFADLTIGQMREVLDVHLMGAIHVTHPAWKVMLAKGHGRILMTSSGASFGMQANSNYVAAKCGLLGLANALAEEGRDHGVFVNSILPYAKTMITKDSPAIGPDAGRNVQLQDELGPRMTLNSVVAVALALISRQSTVTGTAVSTVAGRCAKAFLAVNDGVFYPDVAELTPEDIARDIEQILTDGEIREPGSLGGELELVSAVVKQRAAAHAEGR